MESSGSLGLSSGEKRYGWLAQLKPSLIPLYSLPACHGAPQERIWGYNYRNLGQEIPSPVFPVTEIPRGGKLINWAPVRGGTHPELTLSFNSSIGAYIACQMSALPTSPDELTKSAVSISIPTLFHFTKISDMTRVFQKRCVALFLSA